MRYCLCLLALAAAAFAQNGQTLTGKLSIRNDAPPSLETADHKIIQLSGDDTTSKVLTDTRLNGFEAQLKGHFTGPASFRIDPSHERSLLVRSEGKLKMVTYWCDVCSIRDYTPGPCRCCQKELLLDLRDPDAK